MFIELSHLFVGFVVTLQITANLSALTLAMTRKFRTKSWEWGKIEDIFLCRTVGNDGFVNQQINST